MLSNGFKPYFEGARNVLDSSIINFKAFKQEDNFFAKQHNLPKTKKGKYMTKEQAEEYFAEKEKRRQAWLERKAAEEAASNKKSGATHKGEATLDEIPPKEKKLNNGVSLSNGDQV